MLKFPNCSTEYSVEFLQGMLDRMAVSYYKYGAVKDAYPHKVSAVESLHRYLDKYMETGNLEYLMDCGNFCMIEFMASSHPDAHFRATDSNESPGRAAFDSNFGGTQKSNKELTDNEWKELHSI